MTSKTRKSLSLPDHLVREVKKEAAMNDEAESHVVTRALEEYFSTGSDEGFEDRVEEMLQEVHEATVGGGVSTASSPDGKKKKKNTDEARADDTGGDHPQPCENQAESYEDLAEQIPETGDVPNEILEQGPREIRSHSEGTVDKIVNYLRIMYSHPITNKEIRDAVRRVGGKTDHYLDEYPDRVKEELQNDGWVYFAPKDLWLTTKETFSEMLEMRVEEILEFVEQNEDITESSFWEPDDSPTAENKKQAAFSMARELQNYKVEIVDSGVRDADEIESLVADVQDYALQYERGTG